MMNLKKLVAVIAATAATVVKSIETECNYLYSNPIPYAVDRCIVFSFPPMMETSQMFKCLPDGNITMDRWFTSTTCDGTPTMTLNITEIEKEMNTTVTWKCDGQKSMDDCWYTDTTVSFANDSTCEDVQAYTTVAFLNDLCLMDSESGKYTSLICTPTEYIMTQYTDSQCTEVFNTSSIALNTCADNHDGSFSSISFECNCGTSGCTTVMPEPTDMATTTAMASETTTAQAEQTTAGAEETTAGAEETTTAIEETTSTSGATTSTAAETTTSAEASPANFFVHSQIWSIVVGAFSFVLLSISF